MAQTGISREESAATSAFRAARDLLLARREEYDRAYAQFRWPELDDFNWATDWFDRLAMEEPGMTALWIIEEDGSEQKITYRELADRSRQVAGWLAEHGGSDDDQLHVHRYVTPRAVAPNLERRAK